MKKEILTILKCPKTNEELKFEYSDDNSKPELIGLITKNKSSKYPITNNIPRFVPETNYADNFGLQWNYFSKTQLDSYSGHRISEERFWNATNWKAEKLKGKWVLDIGCGSGRFTEIALKAGAKVVAVDYSTSVNACYENLKDHKNLFVIQGDIYSLPFKDESFDYIYSLGVLQHTPNVRKAFESLVPILKKEGMICVDYYEKSWRSILHLKYWLRPMTKHIPKKVLFKILKILIKYLLPISIFISRTPLIGAYIKRIIPVVNYSNVYPLNKKQLFEWSLLDTFDWFSPMYDNPQTRKKAYQYMFENNLHYIEVLKAGHLVARGKK
jgi:ubiquinone/menaquinone biosynthesis C-methylase UbiE/uncharacterized protein YbaR (Trm112 family)